MVNGGDSVDMRQDRRTQKRLKRRAKNEIIELIHLLWNQSDVVNVPWMYVLHSLMIHLLAPRALDGRFYAYQQIFTHIGTSGFNRVPTIVNIVEHDFDSREFRSSPRARLYEFDQNLGYKCSTDWTLWEIPTHSRKSASIVHKILKWKKINWQKHKISFVFEIDYDMILFVF